MDLSFDIEGLRRRLLQARAGERFVPRGDWRDDAWSPAARRCHENVDRWAARHDGFKAVRGWLVFDFSRASTDLIDVVRFAAHSVLEAPDGSLTDITPAPAAGRYPFVVHPGEGQEFAALVDGLGVSFVDCRKSTIELAELLI